MTKVQLRNIQVRTMRWHIPFHWSFVAKPQIPREIQPKTNLSRMTWVRQSRLWMASAIPIAIVHRATAFFALYKKFIYQFAVGRCYPLVFRQYRSNNWFRYDSSDRWRCIQGLVCMACQHSETTKVVDVVSQTNAYCHRPPTFRHLQLCSKQTSKSFIGLSTAEAIPREYRTPVAQVIARGSWKWCLVQHKQ